MTLTQKLKSKVRLYKLNPLLVCFLLLIFSFTTLAKDLLDIETFPDWLKKDLKKEYQLHGSTNLKIEELGVDTRVVGAFELQEKAENFWYFTASVGKDNAPVECYVFKEYDGPSNSLLTFMDALMPDIAEANAKTLSGTQNFAIDTGMIGNTPYMSYDRLYLLSDDNETLAGILKGLSARVGSTLQICTHNQIGLRETHFNVFKSFVEGMQSSITNTAFFESVQKTSVNGLAVGYISEKFSLGDEGDIHIVVESSSMLPAGDSGAVSVSDAVNDSWSEANGSTINVYEYTIENGTLSAEFSLLNQDGAWQVNGTMQGKDIQSTLAHKGDIVSGYGNYLILQKLRESEENQGSYAMWNSAINPTAVIDVIVKQLEGNASANFEMDFDVLNMQLKANEKFVFESSQLDFGQLKMNVDLMYSAGEPILK